MPTSSEKPSSKPRIATVAPMVISTVRKRGGAPDPEVPGAGPPRRRWANPTAAAT